MNSDSHLPGDPMPADAASGEVELRTFGSPGIAPGPVRSNAHILLVDDEPINVKVIEKFLAAGGYCRLTSAESGQQALDLVASEMPDLLLLDIFLGDINGIEVLKRLRTLPGGAASAGAHSHRLGRSRPEALRSTWEQSVSSPSRSIRPN